MSGPEVNHSLRRRSSSSCMCPTQTPDLGPPAVPSQSLLRNLLTLPAATHPGLAAPLVAGPRPDLGPEWSFLRGGGSTVLGFVPWGPGTALQTRSLPAAHTSFAWLLVPQRSSPALSSSSGPSALLVMLHSFLIDTRPFPPLWALSLDTQPFRCPGSSTVLDPPQFGPRRRWLDLLRINPNTLRK